MVFIGVVIAVSLAYHHSEIYLRAKRVYRPEIFSYQFGSHSPTLKCEPNTVRIQEEYLIRSVLL